MGPADQRDILTARERPFHVLRYLSWTSLVGILIAAALLMLAYRQISVTRFIELRQADALALAYSLFNSVRREFREYLDVETHHSLPPPQLLRAALEDLRKNTDIDDVDIIDDEGIVVFATQEAEIGRKLIKDASVRRALGGRAVSKIGSVHLIWPGSHEEGEHRLRSYIPFHSAHSGRILGVFVMIHDVTPTVSAIEHTEVEVFLVSALIMVMLYTFVLAISRHAHRITRQHEAELYESSHRLKKLSQELVHAQESDKERVAFELHEGIAQTLCALKLRMELMCSGEKPRSGSCALLQQDLLPMFEDALNAVRALAEDVYPSSLSAMGLVRALNAHFREMKLANPSVHVDWVTPLTSVSAPSHLQSTLFRFVADTSDSLVADPSVRLIHVQLSQTVSTLVLEISDDAPLPQHDTPEENAKRQQLNRLRDRVAISGGTLHARTSPWGGTTLEAEWPLTET